MKRGRGEGGWDGVGASIKQTMERKKRKKNQTCFCKSLALQEYISSNIKPEANQCTLLLCMMFGYKHAHTHTPTRLHCAIPFMGTA